MWEIGLLLESLSMRFIRYFGKQTLDVKHIKTPPRYHSKRQRNERNIWIVHNKRKWRRQWLCEHSSAPPLPHAEVSTISRYGKSLASNGWRKIEMCIQISKHTHLWLHARINHEWRFWQLWQCGVEVMNDNSLYNMVHCRRRHVTCVTSDKEGRARLCVVSWDRASSRLCVIKS